MATIPETTQKAPAEKKYQHYHSSRASMCMITPFGMKIPFVAYSFVTDNQECIQYLDEEIRKGLSNVTKGKLLTSEEADPMAALKKRVIEEYLAGQKQSKVDEASGVVKDMGDNRNPAELARAINPATSKTVAN